MKSVIIVIPGLNENVHYNTEYLTRYYRNNLRYELFKRIFFFSDLQQRIPNELLSALATSLVEGPIFEIVSSLTEVQNVTEKQLFRERLQVLRGHSRKSNALSLIL